MPATTSPSTIKIKPLSGTIGAEIRNIDLHAKLTPRNVDEIRRALVDYKVIFFPGQDLIPDEHRKFALYFGEITNGHPILPGAGDDKDVLEIDYTRVRLFEALNRDVARARSTNIWHTDVTFMQTPPLGTVLNAITMPDAGGGDTIFSDSQAAYEALSAPMRAFLGSLRAIHDGRPQYQSLLDELGHGEWDGEVITAIPEISHPIVRTHPESDRKGLFVNPGFTDRIEGLSRHESDALLAFLYQHMTKHEFLVRYHWKAGDLGFWDNRSTMHYVVNDFGKAHRVIQRVAIRGDRPC